MYTQRRAFLGAVAALVLAVPMGAPQAQMTMTNGPTQQGEICMQKVFGTPVNGSNRLNCTANDISLSGVETVFPESCNKGERVTITATFRTNVTANARYDAGYFFRTDGGANARGDGTGATGQCSLSALDPTKLPALNLDKDTAGDLNAGSYLVTFEIPDVLCEDPDGDGFLNLPNCTSWHNNAATVADTSPFGLAQANGFKPETKSKCNCDDDFQVPVRVEPVKLTVEKTAAPTSVSEVGGAVTFTAMVKNEAQFASVKINTIVDQITGGATQDLGVIPNCATGQPSAALPGPCSPVGMTSCPSLIGTTLAGGASATCFFKAYVSGDTGEIHEDEVTICGTGSQDGNKACDSDKATVSITDTVVDPALTKTAVSASCDAKVMYSVVVSNNSDVDTLTVNSLMDDKFGNIADISNPELVSTGCVTGQTVPKNGNYTCTFVAKLSSTACDINHTNEVTGALRDDDGVDFIKSDTATVKVNADLGN